jgi:hypothetical protein
MYGIGMHCEISPETPWGSKAVTIPSMGSQYFLIDNDGEEGTLKVSLSLQEDPNLSEIDLLYFSGNRRIFRGIPFEYDSANRQVNISANPLHFNVGPNIFNLMVRNEIDRPFTIVITVESEVCELPGGARKLKLECPTENRRPDDEKGPETGKVPDDEKGPETGKVPDDGKGPGDGQESDDGKEQMIWVIAAACAGGLVVIVVFVMTLLWCKWKRRSRSDDTESSAKFESGPGNSVRAILDVAIDDEMPPV